MLMTRASEYALLSLVIIASSTSPKDSESLARELDISKSFLAKILQSLARANILNSYKGVNGGFSLAKEPQQISIKEIICAAESKDPSVFDCAKSQQDCPSDQASTCKIWILINKLQGKIDNFLENLFLSDILDD